MPKAVTIAWRNGGALMLAVLIGVAGATSTSAAVAAAAKPTSSAPFYTQDFEIVPSVAAMTALGRALFEDKSLSASGQMACATCHSPSRAFGPPNSLPVQRGGGDMRRAGVRAVPSLMYTQNVPPFTEHYVDDEGDDSIDQGPAGGRTWDGRAESAHEQARLPLFSPFEMGNAGTSAVLSAIRRGGYAREFRATFGEHIFDRPALAFKGVLMALETFQQSAVDFYPYTSKYDAWLRGEAVLTAAESRGRDAFEDPTKGNCARCHPSEAREGAFPQFTDFGYAAIGVPRNAAIPANRDPRYFDLGLCGPYRRDLQGDARYCGLFRTPSLRNVARRRVFFHNGFVHRLADAVRFYGERDTRPEKWYPRAANGGVLEFDDMPSKYRSNIDRSAPFDRRAGDASPLDEGDIADIVAFLDTLTDGYQPQSAGR